MQDYITIALQSSPKVRRASLEQAAEQVGYRLSVEGARQGGETVPPRVLQQRLEAVLVDSERASRVSRPQPAMIAVSRCTASSRSDTPIASQRAGSLWEIASACDLRKVVSVRPTDWPWSTFQYRVSGLPTAWQTLGRLLL